MIEGLWVMVKSRHAQGSRAGFPGLVPNHRSPVSPVAGAAGQEPYMIHSAKGFLATSVDRTTTRRPAMHPGARPGPPENARSITASAAGRAAELLRIC